MEKSIYIIKFDTYPRWNTQVYNKSYTNMRMAWNERKALKACGHRNIEIIKTELITK